MVWGASSSQNKGQKEGKKLCKPMTQNFLQSATTSWSHQAEFLEEPTSNNQPIKLPCRYTQQPLAQLD